MDDNDQTAGQPADLGIDGLTDAVEVGRGGAATVYRCTQAELGRTVAVKVLRGAVGDPDARMRFQRECIAMGMLSGHPNIVTVYSSGFLADGDPYIVMDYMAGGSLAELIEDHGPLPWAQVLRAGVMIAGALESAHASGVLHRDVKPENVMRSSYGSVRLSDFGIARLQGGPETRTTSLTASVLHAAPELLNGQPASVQSDLYAVGSTLHQLLAGVPAFLHATDESLLPVLARIAADPVPNLRPGGVPDDLCALIEQLMAKDPAQRPGSAADVGHRLQQLQRNHHLPVTEMAMLTNATDPTIGLGPVPVVTASVPPPPPFSPRPEPRRDRAGAVVAAAIVVALLAGAGVWIFTRRDVPATPVAQTGPTTAETPSDPSPTATGAAPIPSDPDGSEEPTTETQRPSAPDGPEVPPADPPVLLVPLQTDASRTAEPGVDAAGQEVTYDSDNVVDGRLDTAWRTPGSGLRQTVTLIFEQDVRIQSIGLVPGYAKVDPVDGTDRFFQNRRIRRVRYLFEDGTAVEARFAQDPQLQFVDVDTVSEYVVVEILRTTEPGDRNFTAISEIEVHGNPVP